MQIIKVATTEIGIIIKDACKILAQGGLIIYPTETCYGVGVDATNVVAVNKLLKYKKRPEGKAISIAVSDIKMAEKYVKINDTAKNIYNEFLPGPVTVISLSKNTVAKGIASEENSIGVRIPDHSLTLSIIKEYGGPVTATSANASGKKTPYKINDILENLTKEQKAKIDLVIDAGELDHNPPSTVIDSTRETMKILRRGEIDPGKMVSEKVVRSVDEMQQAAKDLIEKYKNVINKKVILIMFNAELGAGKTQFVKGLASYLEIKENVNSPTFVLVKEYPFSLLDNKGKLLHIDAWRMDSEIDLQKLNISEYYKKGNIIAIEWAGMAEKYLRSLKNDELIKIYIEIEYIDLHNRLLKIYEQE